MAAEVTCLWYSNKEGDTWPFYSDNVIGSCLLWGLTLSQLVTFITGKTLNKVNLSSDSYIGSLAFEHTDFY